MRFDETKSIFLQIRDYVDEMILVGEYPEGERIPSVREMAGRMEVNPNTVIRSYGELQEAGLIENRRGLGYFVVTGAKERVSKSRRDEFIRRSLPGLFRSMEVLNIDFNELGRLYTEYVKGAKE